MRRAVLTDGDAAFGTVFVLLAQDAQVLERTEWCQTKSAGGVFCELELCLVVHQRQTVEASDWLQVGIRLLLLLHGSRLPFLGR